MRLPTIDLSGIDLADCLTVAGIVFSEIGAWKVYHPSAYLLAGLFCFTPLYLAKESK